MVDTDYLTALSAERGEQKHGGAPFPGPDLEDTWLWGSHQWEEAFPVWNILDRSVTVVADMFGYGHRECYQMVLFLDDF